MLGEDLPGSPTCPPAKPEPVEGQDGVGVRAHPPQDMCAALPCAAVASRYDDEIWELVPDADTSPPEHLVRFVGDLGRAERALDLGCGDGRLSASIDAGALTFADVSAVALARARRRLPSARAVELEPDAPLPLDDNAFDLVVCSETVEHVRDVQHLLSEVRRTLQPAGLAGADHARARAPGRARRAHRRLRAPVRSALASTLLPSPHAHCVSCWRT